MNEGLKRLQENHPNQAQIRDQNVALNKFLWNLRDSTDEADNMLDELNDPNLKRLEDIVKKLDKIPLMLDHFLKNDLILIKEFVMRYLRKPSNEHQTHITGNTLFCDNISPLFIVGMGVCVYNNFDAKRVIADMFESLQMKRTDLESLNAFQRRLKSEMMSKKL
ncbi:hypothetical protein IEQ34_010488 [Dendrobium chrysotoxum]|uniref:Uncharacterized protein n=1 Tax=Dendrobium chrysotoxum TaxID=161865 RepID=A0AAV7GDJ5_DENCH|nr:hypothetical protein IEQ34_010488 [Dendrobium chrysotoxum]